MTRRPSRAPLTRTLAEWPADSQQSVARPDDTDSAISARRATSASSNNWRMYGSAHGNRSAAGDRFEQRQV
ncbi:MAG: hypothetical protein EA424_19185 [Planctomycetaceae bacterium]|nr:MAG: hypothetical protein EA424_19185 [Planctomycetaceae bacterium]